MGAQTKEALEAFKAHVASLTYTTDELVLAPEVGKSVTLLQSLAFSLDSVRAAPRKQNENLASFQDKQAREWDKIQQRRRPASTDDFLV